MRARWPLRIAVVTVAAGFSAAAAGSGAKPVIGRPTASPAQPQPGSVFRVAFRVTHATSAKFSVTIGGKTGHHTDSFRGGLARTAVTVPESAAGKSLDVTLTARAGAQKATKRVTFAVGAGPPPSLAINDVVAPEGNSGTTPFSFKVTLSHATTKAVSVKYATSDDTATAPSDYIATSGTLTFNPGETTKAIVVQVVGDTVVEADESFFVTLSDAVNATIANDTGSGGITNDDTAAPVSAGSYQGATQEGNYVYFTVTANRTITQFRSNSLTENCNGGSSYIQGSVTWGSQEFPVAADGTFDAEYSWSGSQTFDNGVELTAETWKLTGTFTTGTTMNGTIALADEENYQRNHYSCSGSVTFSATLQS